MPAKLALINARSVRNEADSIVAYIVEHDVDIICFTETWLSGNDAATIAAITHDGYDFRHFPRPNRRGGGVGILFKTTLHLCSVTPLPAKTFECIEVVLRVRHTSNVRIVTIYRPPSSGKNTTPFSEFITEFSHVLDRAATRPTDISVVADGCCVVTDDGSCDCTLGMALVMDVYWLYGFEYPKELRKTFSFLEKYVFTLKSARSATWRL